ncbi:MAG: two-component regulator propeller domain-containing protein, partial [Panacibacter sp.]
MLRNIYMALVIMLFHFTVTGQTVAVKTLKMQAITINDGLSQGMINCIYQDHFGFMWFGTMDGLNRYDGYHFIVYRHDVFDSASVSGNFITTIFEDSKQRLWIGTALNGLNIFDRETERFIHLDHENGLLNSVSENRILSVQEDKFGAIWVGTAGGLNKIVVLENQQKHKFNSPYTTTVKHIYFDTVNRNNELFSLHYETGNTDYFEPSFFIDSKGVIWVGTEHTLFNIIQSAGKNDIIKEVDNKKFASDKYELQYTKNHIHNYVEDTAGNIIYLLRKKYITSFNQDTKEVLQFNCGDIDPGIFRSQFIVQSGIIWHATGGRLYQYDLGGNNIYNIQLKTYNSDKNLKEFYCVYKDRSGIIWIGTRGYG